MEIACIGRPGEDEVADQRTNEDRREAEDQLGLLEEHEVAHTADHAEPRPLRQRTDDETSRQADEDRRMQRAGPAPASLKWMNAGASSSAQRPPASG